MLKSNAFMLILAVTMVFSCKKNHEHPGDIPEPAPVVPVKKPRGNPAGPAVTAVIGTAGGKLISNDGVLKIDVPAGAVDKDISFSVQAVENSFGSGMPSYRLLPEGTDFKKEISIEYDYSVVSVPASLNKVLRLGYQDKEGYFHSPKISNKVAGKQIITAKTKHFSDWFLYSSYELKPVGRQLKDGKIFLREKEQVDFQLTETRTNGDPAKPSGDDLVLIYESGVRISTAKWELFPNKGKLQVNPFAGRGTVEAPASFEDGVSGTTLTVTLTGDLGKDNEGFDFKQLIIFQEIVYETDEFFDVSIAGANHTRLKQYVVEPGAFGLVIGGYVGETSFEINSSLHGTGSKSFGDLGKGFAHGNILTPNETGFMSFRPKICDQGDGLVYSDGNVTITSYATKKNEYTEGSFSATMFNIGWCKNATTKSISGKFRIRKK